MLKQQIIEKIQRTPCTYSRLWLNQINKFAQNVPRLNKLASSIELHLNDLIKRQELIKLTKVHYPSELPVSREVNQIKQVIQNNQITLICGETGSGKTTQLPKILLELGYAASGIIGHTQPRRIAARSLAARIGQELGQTPQSEFNLVGYKMRFHDRTSSSTAIKLMTDGILLQEIQTDKLLLQYSALIIDEVHERSLNIDFILGYLQQLIKSRPDLKIIITSATLENEKLAKFFAGAPIVNVSGKTHPVDIIYQPLLEDDDDANLNQAIYQAISAALSVERGNGLVFLPGEREIKQCLNFLRKTELHNYELLPLFSRQNNDEQSLIFAESGRIKIILATNIAETSLTIPGIKFVIDSGIARVKRYSLRNRVEQLQVETISQASSRQRAGRAGRVSHGMCVRLFSEQEFNLRSEFTEPELLRSNLANVILRLLSLNLGEPNNFPFLDQPEPKAFNDGFRTLFQVGAINEDNQITLLGRKLAQIPIDVQLARILLAAGEKFACLAEALVVVAFLAIQDPRDFPLEHQQLARERHAIWADKQSEFNQMLNLWRWYHEQLEHKKSNKKLLEICHKQFVSLLRLREWHELHRQLKETMLGLGYKENSQAADYTRLHSAILSGFVVNIGQKDLVDNYYLGTNGRKFYLHPSLNVDNNKWMVAASLVETTRLYARHCAHFEPLWLNGIANHLFKYTYSNQHWDIKRGEVVANKSALLYGLQIHQQRVSFGLVDPKLAQEILIREGLVANQLSKKYAFIEHNLQVIRELEKLEDKLRTSLALMDDELYSFYASHLTPEVVDLPSLEQFLLVKPELLKIKQAEFIERLTSTQQSLELYPDQLIINGQTLRLKYVFDHDSPEDGVVVFVDLAKLSLIENEPFAWLVPGMIRDKLAYLIKSLPKSQRVQFNPLQDSITEFLEQADLQQNLLLQLVDYAKIKKNLALNYLDLVELKLPTQLRCHFRIMDKKRVIASGDDLALIKLELAPMLSKIVVQHTSKQQINNLSGYIPEMSQLLSEVKLNAGGTQLVGYLSLIVEKDTSVSFGVVADLAKAKLSSRRGLVSLIKLQLKEQQKYLASKKAPNFPAISFALIDVYTKDDLSTSCCQYILNQAISAAIEDSLPKSLLDFEQMVASAKQNVTLWSVEFNQCLERMAKFYSQVKLKMAEHALEDEIILQLDDLIYPEFLNYTKWQFLVNYPRYLQAMLSRMERYSKSTSRDKVISEEVNFIYNKWYNYVEELEQKHKVVSSELYAFKYKIEELRISLFAQEIKTLYPVSSKRLLTELHQLYLNNLI